MLRKNKKQEDTGFDLRLFNSRNPSDIQALNAILDAEIARSDEENLPLNLTHEKMVAWLKKYVNCPEFLNSYSETRSLKLVAEATFWSVKLELEPYLAKMSYAEIRKFSPLEETFSETKSERAKLIEQVLGKLRMPSVSFEASYAMGQAAWCVYLHNNSFENFKKEQIQYEAHMDESPSMLRR